MEPEGPVRGLVSRSQNIGYVIPVPVIQHFLDDTDPEDSSRCEGFCSLGIMYQGLENDQLPKPQGCFSCLKSIGV